MKGWGSVTCLVVLGLALVSGCGSRTSGFDDFYYDDEYDGFGGTELGMGGVSGIAGRAGAAAAGNKPVGGKGSSGGAFTAGSSAVAGFGGVVGTGGFAVAGFSSGGVAGFSSGGVAGVGFGGVAGFSSGGVAGVGFGGAAGFGAAPVAGTGGVTQSCQSCLFDNCAGQFLQCLQDVGCIEIIVCAQREACEGLRCYSEGACKRVIDRWGGPAGKSMNELLQTFSCAVNAGCPCN